MQLPLDGTHWHELKSLIAEYNKIRGKYLFLYSAAVGEMRSDTSIIQNDFYIIRDLLAKISDVNELDFYIETPGGSGEAVAEIVGFLRSRFQEVNFIIAGEAKSAGTILALSGDNILMTETASLGPIDAQLPLGRSWISAYDHINTIRQIKEQAEKTGKINPVDAILISQMTYGEIKGIENALEFAKDLVVEWIPKYKFKNWTCTETTKKNVTEEMKKARAKELAEALVNSEKWRKHSRSIKILDLEEIGLKITKLDDDKKLADIVYRIHTLLRIIYERTKICKVFASVDDAIIKECMNK